ncbi:serine/threonine protein phosphatase PrpC [Devosia sp. UYZn731]|uniref:PP2C family protein-serine/threonine phosphatase n=1 Tax=Devosia sp. UYZn731 TaxID=3156345 RepID=UPI0033916CF2
MAQFLFDSWAATHPGKVRDVNEDNFLAEPSAGLWVVADGMGGYEAGEVASGAIISHLSTLGRSTSPEDQRARFIDRLDRANREVFDYSTAKGSTVGSTVVALMAYGDSYQAAWVGDSRIYQIRDGRIRQLSRDHSQVQELIEAGVLSPSDARSWQHRNVITRAVGIGLDLHVDFVDGVFQHSDVFVVCSDGLTTHLEDEEIEGIAHGRRPREACEQLVDLVLERGASDNVTVVVVSVWQADLTVPLSERTAIVA